MKTLALAALLLTTPLFAATKPDPANYTLTVHVVCSSVRAGATAAVETIGVTVDGQPMELSAARMLPLLPGDYKARIAKEYDANSYEIGRTYEMLLPDGKTGAFTLTGLGPQPCAAS